MTKPSSWQIVEEPLRALADVVDQLPAVMLVGAACRDVLHEEHGHKGALRRTTTSTWLWQSTDGTSSRTRRRGSRTCATARVQSDISSAAAGWISFRSVRASKLPTESLALPPSGHGMSVYGFQDVFDESREIDLGAAFSCRLPTTPGYVLLKLVKAWIDRRQTANTRTAATSLAPSTGISSRRSREIDCTRTTCHTWKRLTGTSRLRW